MPDKKSVLDFNLDLQFFLKKFQKYKRNVNIVDKDTISLMTSIIKNIDKFLDKAVVIESNKNDSCNFDFEENRLEMCNPFINCKLCKMQINPSLVNIKKHITNQRHKNLLLGAKTKSIPPNIVVSFKNNKNVVPVPINNVPVQNNNNKNNQVEPAEPFKKGARPMKSIKLKRSLRTFLELDITSVIKDLINDGQNQIHLEEYNILQQSLIKKLKPTYPNVKIYYFGSRINGLGNDSTDLDIFIDVDNNYNSYFPNIKNIKIIRKFKTILFNNNENKEWSNVVEVLKARTPILKVFNNLIDIDCDISCSNGLGHCNTQLVKYYLDLQPVCMHIAIYVKIWSKQIGILNMSSYVLIMMVIFFLQIKKLLPSVQLLQEDLIDPNLIGVWQADIVEKSLNDLKIPRNDNFVEYLIEFFHYYGYIFNYKKDVISTYFGSVINKKEFDLNNLKSLKIPSYQNYIETLNLKVVDCEKDLFAYKKPLCVQDPYELIHNIGKGVMENELNTFTEYCCLTENILKEKYQTKKI